MKNTKLNIRKLTKQGFSLIEMLVVIAVIGVIAAIAIPNIGNINQSARDATAQRNAQNVASTVAAAVAAGWSEQAGSVSSGDVLAAAKADVIDSIAEGIVIGDGPFKDRRFVVPNIPATGSSERTDLETYLTWDDTNNIMEYDADAAASN